MKVHGFVLRRSIIRVACKYIKVGPNCEGTGPPGLEVAIYVWLVPLTKIKPKSVDRSPPRTPSRARASVCTNTMLCNFCNMSGRASRE